MRDTMLIYGEGGKKGLLAWHKLKMWYQVPIACSRVCGDKSRIKVLKREYKNLA